MSVPRTVAEVICRELTLEVGRVKARHEEAVRAAGEAGYRFFRLCFSCARYGFETRAHSLCRTLLVKPDEGRMVRLSVPRGPGEGRS